MRGYVGRLAARRALKRLKICQQRPDFRRLKFKWRHLHMAYDDAFGESLGQLFDGIAFVQTAKGRRLFQRAIVGAPDTVTARTVRAGDFAPCFDIPARGMDMSRNETGESECYTEQGCSLVHAVHDVHLPKMP